MVAENTAAHAPHHRAVALNERLDCGLFVLADEALQELPIGQPRPIASQHCLMEVVDNLGPLICRHVHSLVEDPSLPTLLLCVGASFIHFFCFQTRIPKWKSTRG